MRSKNVVLLESNSAVVEQLRDEMNKTVDFKLVYVGDEGDEGMRKILQLKPDVVITAMFLKGTDGSGVIQYTRKTLPTVKSSVRERQMIHSLKRHSILGQTIIW